VLGAVARVIVISTSAMVLSPDSTAPMNFEACCRFAGIASSVGT